MGAVMFLSRVGGGAPIDAPGLWFWLLGGAAFVYGFWRNTRECRLMEDKDGKQ